MALFDSLTQIFQVFFMAGAGWFAASFTKELLVSVINQVASAIVIRKQMAHMKKYQSLTSEGN